MRKLAFFAMAFVHLLFGCGQQPPADPSPVTLDAEMSFLSDFTVEGDVVKMNCYITLLNSDAEDHQVELRAYSPQDVRGGLLSEPEMLALERYLVPANGSASYDVTFEGVHGGGATKVNRLLPEIQIFISGG